jgi:hypothetical protein
MGIASQEFEGITTNIPGIYSDSDYPASLGAVRAASANVVVIGEAKGGIPYNATVDEEIEKLNPVTSVPKALDLLVGGPAYYMTEFYLTPTRDEELSVPSKCFVCAVNPMVRATSAVKNVAALADIIDLKARRYGAQTNQLTRSIVAGTVAGKKITIKFRGKLVAEKDNVGMAYFSIQYTGAGTAATLTINGTQLSTTITGGPGSENLALTFADFSTIGQLVAYINEQAGYTCVLLGRSDAASSTLDAVTTQAIKATAYNCRADVEAVIQFFNTESQGEIIAALHTGAAREALGNDANFIFFAGGSDGTTTSTNWSEALAFLKRMNINHILVASGDPTIHAMVATHIQEMSSIENKANRSAGAGATSGKTKAARIAEMKVLGSARLEYWNTPIYRYDLANSSQKRLFDPFYGAALGAGIRFANHITTSVTFKNVNVLALGEELEREDKKDIIDAGGSLIERNDRGFTVTHNVSTYQAANLILNLPSMLRTCDFITLDSQAKLLAMIAKLKKAPNSLVISSIQNYAITNLLPGYVDDGLLTKDPNTGAAAFSDVEFSLHGDRFNFAFTGIVPAPLHFMFIKQTFIITGSR